MRAAYADPPYLGLAEAFYGKIHPEAAEYDKPETHRLLVERMMDEYDAWAMSLHEPSLAVILPMCPKGSRVMAWVKPWCSFKPGRKDVHAAWEPVIVWEGRPRTKRLHAVRDYVIAPISRNGFRGSKSEPFCYWMFEILNLVPDDEFCDLFPGSGAVGRAWDKWKNRMAPEQLELVPSNVEVRGWPQRAAERAMAQPNHNTQTKPLSASPA